LENRKGAIWVEVLAAVESPVMDAADFPECGEDTVPLEAHAGRQGGNRRVVIRAEGLSERSASRGE
jgi:hypothetical protein